MKRYQTGATLIIVLIFLILIISVGAVAVRQSVTDLKIATNDQVDTLLLNTSDGVPAHLEQAINANGKEYSQLIGAGGPFGYFMNALGDNTRGDQLVFCYNPRSAQFFSFTKATVLTPDGGNKITGGSGANTGYCDTADTLSYTNARNTTMVQVVITRPDAVNTPTKAFEAMPVGRDASVTNPGSSNPLFEIYSTALLPALSNTTDAKINECLKKPNRDATRFSIAEDTTTKFDETLSKCLQDENVPNMPLIEQVRMSNTEESEECVFYGEGTGKMSEVCQSKFNFNEDGTPSVTVE